jgi:hypothetical protein
MVTRMGDVTQVPKVIWHGQFEASRRIAYFHFRAVRSDHTGQAEPEINEQANTHLKRPMAR